MNVTNGTLPLQQTLWLCVNSSEKKWSALQRSMDSVCFFWPFRKNIYSWFSSTLKWTCTQLLLNSSFHECCCVNSWNAFLKEKLNMANSSCKKGNCFKLPFFVTRYKNELLVKYQKLTLAEKQTLIAKVQSAHNSKVVPTCANQKTCYIFKDGAQCTFVLFFCCLYTNAYDFQWTELSVKTSMKGFFIGVQGSIEDHTKPKVFFTEKLKNRCALFLTLSCIAWHFGLNHRSVVVLVSIWWVTYSQILTQGYFKSLRHHKEMTLIKWCHQ